MLLRQQVLIYTFLPLFLTLAGCENQPRQTDGQRSDSANTSRSDSTVVRQNRPTSPEWAENATIYEVNIRHFSPEGNLAGVEKQLPRLKELGVDILWLMPIYPIGQEKRKGTLGSPYAVADFKAVNPAYGTLNDLRKLTKLAHDLGMRVILDFVPNHTAWDHPWVKQHPDWYTRNSKGELISPLNEQGKPTGWLDVVDLNFNQPDMRNALVEALTYWVREADVDGYRMDVAGLVPLDFWQELRPALDKLKPVFLLAEAEAGPEQYNAGFNVNYGWAMHALLKNIAKGTAPATGIDSLLTLRAKAYPTWAYPMLFTQNHDENAWNGTLTESFGPGANAFVVLTSTLPGMPLVHNGAESGLRKRLAFFEKDPIAWGTYPETNFYKSLLTLKHRNRALWNGEAGGTLVRIPTGHDEQVYAFSRQRDEDRVVVITNLTGQLQSVRLSGEGYAGTYTDIFEHKPMELKTGMTLILKPWEYHVLTN